MKKLISSLLFCLAASGAFGATLTPIQLLNPTGSTTNQAITSSGSSTAPAWTSIVNSVAGRTGAVTLSNTDVSGLGTAALVNTGTVGHTLPYLDGTNTWGGVNTFSTPIAVGSGGTGVGTLTGLALGSGTSAFSAYGGTSCTNQFPRSLNASGAATCATVSLTADVTGITPTANGGTGIAYFTAAGPTVARVYTFPDAAATILYSGGALGTPSSGIATNLTGTASGLTAGNVTTNANLTGPITSSGNATSVASQTGSGSNFVMDNGPTLIAPALGTPVSGVATNLTGTASGLTAGNVTTNANLTGPITSSGNATSVAAQTGTGSTFVMQASPTLTTPTIGVATATSVNKMAITAPTTSSTLAVADGKTLTASNTLTLSGTDSTTMTFPSTSATMARTDAAQTFTGNQTYSNTILAASGSASAPSISFSAQSTLGLYRVGTNNIAVVGSSNTPTISFGQALGGFLLGSGQTLGFSSFADPSGGGGDALFVRGAANTIAQRNGTNAQNFWISNTFTDTSNYERLVVGWSSNLAVINTAAAGTGTQRTLGLQTAAGRVLIGTTTDDASNTLQVNGNTKVTGSVAYTKQEVDLSYTYNQPTTGQTVTLASGTETAIIDPAGTLAALTVTLPGCTSGYDGSIARFSSTQIVTVLTVNATSGSVADAPTTIGVGGGNGYICRGSNTTWYRMY